MTFNHKLHPKHIYRDLNPFITPRLRSDDMPDVDDFIFTRGKETRSLWCEDKLTRETLFVCSPPKTMREAMIAGYMMGKAAGYKSHEYYGSGLVDDLFAEDRAHYLLYGYYPDEMPDSPPIVSDPSEVEGPALGDLPTAEDDPVISKASTVA